jgi:hypothetical protein
VKYATAEPSETSTTVSKQQQQASSGNMGDWSRTLSIDADRMKLLRLHATSTIGIVWPWGNASRKSAQTIGNEGGVYPSTRAAAAHLIGPFWFSVEDLLFVTLPCKLGVFLGADLDFPHAQDGVLPSRHESGAVMAELHRPNRASVLR